jgi:hypothetical protein
MRSELPAGSQFLSRRQVEHDFVPTSSHPQYRRVKRCQFLFRSCDEPGAQAFVPCEKGWGPEPSTHYVDAAEVLEAAARSARRLCLRVEAIVDAFKDFDVIVHWALLA